MNFKNIINLFPFFFIFEMEQMPNFFVKLLILYSWNLWHNPPQFKSLLHSGSAMMKVLQCDSSMVPLFGTKTLQDGDSEDEAILFRGWVSGILIHIRILFGKDIEKGSTICVRPWTTITTSQRQSSSSQRRQLLAIHVGAIPRHSLWSISVWKTPKTSCWK